MEEGTPPRLAELHAELRGLTLGQLLEKAELLGVDDEELDDAEEEQEVIAMIVAKVEEQVAAEETAQVARLKEELGSMKLRALYRKAQQLGVDKQKLDAAKDKAATVALIVELSFVNASGGMEPEPETEPEPELQSEPQVEPESEPEPKSFVAVPYTSTSFDREEDFPSGILSYASRADGKKGRDHMWAIANALRKQGITTFNGKMVNELNWKVEWFGALAQAEFAVVMPCEAFWNSECCIQELEAILQRGIPVFLARVCATFDGSVPEEDFLGTTTERQKLAAFFQNHAELSKNCVPSPSQPLFQENFERNSEILWTSIVKKLPHLSFPRTKPDPELQLELGSTAERIIINQPGKWDVMISYTQRNLRSEALAQALHGEFKKRNLTVWLDIKMTKRDEAAMEEGVKNSRCVVAIVSAAVDGHTDRTAYFERELCLKELRWAQEAGVFIQPVVAAEEKERITEFFGTIPADLQHLRKVNWEHIDRKDKEYFELGVTKIEEAMKSVQQPEPEAQLTQRISAPRGYKLETEIAAAILTNGKVQLPQKWVRHPTASSSWYSNADEMDVDGKKIKRLELKGKVVRGRPFEVGQRCEVFSRNLSGKWHRATVTEVNAPLAGDIANINSAAQVSGAAWIVLNYSSQGWSSSGRSDQKHFEARMLPRWVHEDETSHCMVCERAFSVSTGRQHCAYCGWVICLSCCSKVQLEVDRWVEPTGLQYGEIVSADSVVSKKVSKLVCNACYKHAPTEMKQRERAATREAEAPKNQVIVMQFEIPEVHTEDGDAARGTKTMRADSIELWMKGDTFQLFQKANERTQLEQAPGVALQDVAGGLSEMAKAPLPITKRGTIKPPVITDSEDDEPAPEPALDGKIVDEAPMVSLQTKGVDSKVDDKGKEYIEYTFGLYIGHERVHTIEDRYSKLRDDFKDLPKLMPGGCAATFPGKHVMKDTTNDNDAIRERARELREFFAALLVDNDFVLGEKLMDIHSAIGIDAELSRRLVAAARKRSEWVLEAGEDIVNGKKCGWLYKQGKVVKNWKRRWFVLDYPKLMYYSNPNDLSTPKGEIDCDQITLSEKHAAAVVGRDHCFALYHPDRRTFFLQADSEVAMMSWVQAIRHDATKCGLIDFEEKALIGQGNFGRVLLVRYKKTGENYAMKVLNKDNLRRQDIEHTKTERSVLRKIRHPFVVSLNFAFQTGSGATGKLYMVMDYVPGGDLYYHLRRQSKFPEEVVVGVWAAELTQAIGYVHSLGIVFRDLKLENLLLDAKGHIHLADFGLAKEVYSLEQKLTTFCGTPFYMAPELVRTQQSRSARRAERSGYTKEVDWWALGVIIFELMTGQPPFNAQSMHELYRKIDAHPIDRVIEALQRDALSTPTEATRDLVRKLLERDPSRRLGAGEKDAEAVQEHPAFAGIDWEQLLQKRIEPSYHPDVKDANDTSNFDPTFTRKKFTESDCLPSAQQLAERREGAANPFDGFTFVDCGSGPSFDRRLPDVDLDSDDDMWPHSTW